MESKRRRILTKLQQMSAQTAGAFIEKVDLIKKKLKEQATKDENAKA